MTENKKTAGETAKSEVEVFTFNPSNQQIRVETIGGEPWFVAKDVCQALGIENNRDAVARLDEDEKGVGSTDTLRGKQTVTLVNESGLYNLIFQSRKAEARAFRRWVTGEVLPTIRRTGRYELAAERGGCCRRKVAPRDRSEALGAFYAELGKWVLKEDVRLVAAELDLKEGTVRSALRGTGSNLKVLELLVPLAAGNREAGRRSDYRVAGRSTELAMGQLMLTFMGEEGGAR